MQQSHEVVFRPSTLNNQNTSKVVKGYDFNQGIDYEKILHSYESTGIQSIYLIQAIDTVWKMINGRDEEGKKCYIYLGLSSSIISSGLRETVKFLVKNKLVDCIVTTGRAVEYDIMKCYGDFYVKESEEVPSSYLQQGNILIPESLVKKYEVFLDEILDECIKDEEKGERISASIII